MAAMRKDDVIAFREQLIILTHILTFYKFLKFYYAGLVLTRLIN